MTQANPYAPVIETGASLGGTAGPVGGSASGKIGLGTVASPDDHHVSAAIVLGAVVVLIALWKSKFRFSMAVGGR